MYSATGVEPTKLTAAMSGWARMASTASLPPLTTLMTPSGTPASSHQLGQGQRAGRVLLRRLEDEGVAAGDGERRHPQRDHGREVEGRDAGADADRVADREQVDAAADLMAELALHQLRQAAGELDHLEPAGDRALRVLERLAVLVGDQAGQPVDVLARSAP